MRKPFGHRLDACGEITGLSDAQAKSRHRELCDAVDAAMGHMRYGPNCDRDGVAKSRAYDIDDPTEAQIADCIGCLEPEDDIGIVGFRPLHFRRQGRL